MKSKVKTINNKRLVQGSKGNKINKHEIDIKDIGGNNAELFKVHYYIINNDTEPEFLLAFLGALCDAVIYNTDTSEYNYTIGITSTFLLTSLINVNKTMPDMVVKAFSIAEKMFIPKVLCSGADSFNMIQQNDNDFVTHFFL